MPRVGYTRSLLCAFGKVEEPGKMVEYHQYARSYKLERGQGDERPALAEVLEVNQVAEDPKSHEM